MHRYLRAVGFSQYTRLEEAKNLLDRFLQEADGLTVVEENNGDRLAMKRVHLGRRIGVDLWGFIDSDGTFSFEYCFPWHEGNEVSTTAECQIQRHSARDEFSGIVKEEKVGLSLIFYLQNAMKYLQKCGNATDKTALTKEIRAVMLSGMCLEGKVLIPSRIVTEEDKPSMKDCDDLYSFVQTTFLPYGVESDQYAVLGTITGVETIRNCMTGEELYSLTILCNEMTFQICINQRDLIGVPEVGRRFKGNIWMVGKVVFEG